MLRGEPGDSPVPKVQSQVLSIACVLQRDSIWLNEAKVRVKLHCGHVEVVRGGVSYEVDADCHGDDCDSDGVSPLVLPRVLCYLLYIFCCLYITEAAVWWSCCDLSPDTAENYAPFYMRMRDMLYRGYSYHL